MTAVGETINRIIAFASVLVWAYFGYLGTTVLWGEGYTFAAISCGFACSMSAWRSLMRSSGMTSVLVSIARAHEIEKVQ